MSLSFLVFTQFSLEAQPQGTGVKTLLWTYLHSNFRSVLRKTHVLSKRVRNGRSRSSKVVDFGTNRKRVCNFLLVINSPVLHRSEIWRLTGRRKRQFSRSNFWINLILPKLEFLCYLIVACVILTQCQRVTHGRTDRQTFRRWLYYRALHSKLCWCPVSKSTSLYWFLRMTVYTMSQKNTQADCLL